eukprot:11756023-Ditylum_brightwellii.AAC.1
MLYKMNNESTCEKQHWAQTGNWFFVPFGEDSSISLVHIANMSQYQNVYIRDAVNITVSGITNIKAYVKNLESFATTSFGLWILSVKSKS